jgi:4a-hydroxytetrahydrobiopterin dehydratase
MDGWTETGTALIKEWTFEDFAEAMIFVNRVAEVAEKAHHHPDFTIVWNRVTLTLRTHDTGALTSKDYALAEALNAL